MNAWSRGFLFVLLLQAHSYDFFLAVIVLLICGAISPITKYESLNPNSNSESLFLSISRSFKSTFVNGRTLLLLAVFGGENDHLERQDCWVICLFILTVLFSKSISFHVIPF